MSDIIKALRETVRGRVIGPAESDYDDARAVYNAMHDRKPRALIQCVDSADVMAAVAAGRDGGLDLAIRGGGHSVPGFGTVDDGLVIDPKAPLALDLLLEHVQQVHRIGGYLGRVEVEDLRQDLEREARRDAAHAFVDAGVIAVFLQRLRRRIGVLERLAVVDLVEARERDVVGAVAAGDAADDRSRTRRSPGQRLLRRRPVRSALARRLQRQQVRAAWHLGGAPAGSSPPWRSASASP